MTPEQLAYRQGYELGRAEGWARAMTLLRAAAKGMRDRGQADGAFVIDVVEKEMRGKEHG